MTGPSLRPHAYVLAVHDLDSETAYFIDVLGFSREWSEAGNWEGLIRGDVRLHLGRCPESLRVSELGDHSYFGFFATDDVDSLATELTAAGARITSPPTDRPWGWREMGVVTPEGHRMKFAQRLKRT
jgi:predicted enzyme related to lactoylglutathione lyase